MIFLPAEVTDVRDGRKERVAQFLKQYEVDSWKAYVDSALNWHNRVERKRGEDEPQGDTRKVSFTRFMDPQE